MRLYLQVDETKDEPKLIELDDSSKRLVQNGLNYFTDIPVRNAKIILLLYKYQEICFSRGDLCLLQLQHYVNCQKEK